MAVDVTLLQQVLTLCYTNRPSRVDAERLGFSQVVPLVWGMQGIGKSAINKQFAKSVGVKDVKRIAIGVYESPGDLLGMPMVKNGMRVYAQPAWYPQPGQSCVLLWDELNRGNNLLQQMMLPILLDRRIGEYPLPRECFQWAAANPPTEEFIVNDLDAALLDRCLHIPFEPSVEDWLTWGEGVGIQSDVLAFIDSSEDCLDGSESGKIPVTVKPSRRSWTMLSVLVGEEPTALGKPLLLAVATGLLGATVAGAFVEWCFKREERKPLNPEQIVNSYPLVRSYVRLYGSARMQRFDLLVATMKRLRRYLRMHDLSPEQERHVEAFLRDLPAEVLQLAKVKGV